MKKCLLLISLSNLLPMIASAETLTCTGEMNTSPTSQIEIKVDMENNRSTIRYVLPDGSRYSQGLGINTRKYKGTKIIYTDKMNPYKTLQVDTKDGKISQAIFNNKKANYVSNNLSCDIFGSIPPQPACSKNPNQSLAQALINSTDTDTIERAVECGANVNYADSNGCTPLMFALNPNCGSTEKSQGPYGLDTPTKDFVDFLLNNGAFANTADRKGETPLMKAAKNSVQDVYDSFVAAEADFDSQDNSGHTALMYAVLSGDKWIVSSVLDGNPDRKIKNKKAQTAYDLAVQQQNEDIIDLVKIPDVTVVFSGQDDGTCSPLTINLKSGDTVELVLKSKDKMLMLESSQLNIGLMADSNGIAKKIFKAATRGSYPFTCGAHGGSQQSQGVINIQ